MRWGRSEAGVVVEVGGAGVVRAMVVVDMVMVGGVGRMRVVVSVVSVKGGGGVICVCLIAYSVKPGFKGVSI